ncbi:MAG: FAD-dependent oxidoreductase [Candidatus Marinimicrobia bacterium]|nr:FAD-dependent oxidoreductase [Candidatus Neomarinimicrobiota bacterium]
MELTINDKKIEFSEGMTLLECTISAGINIPTLCSHKALSPYGACRLCLVEVSQNGSSSIQASCTYPALPDLVVYTDTEQVVKTRKIIIELLMACCPESEQIQQLAAEHGITESRIPPKDDDCYLCGLCVRMCHERMGIGAINFVNRGFRRKVSPPFDALTEICQTCGACSYICPTNRIDLGDLTTNRPIPILNEYNAGLNDRSAIYIPYPQAVPNKAVIDDEFCVHMLKGECEICSEFCEAEAIDYDQKEESIELDVGAVVLTPGFELFDPGQKEELGYNLYPNVVSALEFERILSASGPYLGKVLRPSDNRPPQKIAFLQCVGSRDHERDYCSSVCCMYATKEAIIAKEHAGDELECDIFFMDMRAFSKGFDEYYQRAKTCGVNYIRCRIPAVAEDPHTNNLIIKYLTEGDQIKTREYDLVVLATGIVPPATIGKTADILDIALNEYNFCQTKTFQPVASTRAGVFVAGPISEPKDIPETVMQASGAAAKVLSLLKDSRGSRITTREYPPEIEITGQRARVGVFVCHCGSNIAGVVNVPAVTAYAQTLPDVVYTESNLYTCSNDTQEAIKEKIKEYALNRVVVASCTPRTHEPLFRNTLREIGLNPYLFEMANIRDQCSWVHMFEPEKATEKAKDLVSMAVAKARLLEPLQKRLLSINQAALVIGGGLAGMTSALELANQGFEVYLVEKEKELGGNLRHIHYLLNGDDPQLELNTLIAAIEAAEKIQLHTAARIENIEGSIGNFTTQVVKTGSSAEIKHGIVIVATGAAEYKPQEYLYGQDPNVITQRELEQQLATNGESMFEADKQQPKTVVMIQCVGSRCEERPYCSRVCCSEAIKNALKIKDRVPDTNIYILYRDIRTYGFKEGYYTKAREHDVVFIRYDEGCEPVVSKNGSGLTAEVFDQILGMAVEISADMVVLSTGVIPGAENERTAQLLKVPLGSDGFFLEAHMKLRPVDFATEGVFLCGMAHSAKTVEESIIQAQAAASRAATILTKDSIELEATISKVVDANCDGCAYCVEPCPYNAITLIECMHKGVVKKTVEVNESLCKGCGSCQATCPKQGIIVRGFKLEQITAQVEAALGVG